uniref:Kelch repeat and K+ channel tetramerization domain-containing protein n=1 Tax=Toxoplasma gondii COUG TaxID=1074873 RepID=A0A2G8YDU2_TOXGO|nr:kelch repeat and K+ channel tetramerization domain-containing protein [Toxoplasma gondii COUG]
MNSEVCSRFSFPSPQASASCAALSSFDKKLPPIAADSPGLDHARPTLHTLRYLGAGGVSSETGRLEPEAVGNLPRAFARTRPGLTTGTTLSSGSSAFSVPLYSDPSCLPLPLKGKSFSPLAAMNSTGNASPSSLLRRGSADDALAYPSGTSASALGGSSRSPMEAGFCPPAPGPAVGTGVGGLLYSATASPEFLCSSTAGGPCPAASAGFLSSRVLANGGLSRLSSRPFDASCATLPRLSGAPTGDGAGALHALHALHAPVLAEKREPGPAEFLDGDRGGEERMHPRAASGDTEEGHAAPFASAEDFETMVGDLRRTFIGWLKKTESDLRKEKRDLVRAKKEFEEERKQAREKLQQEKKIEYEKIKEERRKAQAEMATQIKQIQVEREDARRKLNAERGRFEEEKEAHRRRTLLEKERFRQEAEALDAEKRRIVDANIATETVVDLNVGGVVFEASRHTFVQQPGSFLETLLSGRHHVSRDKQGRIFLDRDSELFRIILNFLRNPAMPPQPRDSAESDAITQEADFLGIRFFPFPLVFAVGGHNGVEHLRSLEVLDIGQQCWRPCKAMQTERAYFGSSVFQNRLFVYGGQNLDYKALCETEVFDALRDVWMTGAALNVPRRNTCGTFMGARHFAIGGFDGSDILSSVECYDPRMKNWMQVAPLTTPRSSAMCCVRDDHLYVLGGTNGERLRTVEMYDHRMNKWEVLPSEMIEVRSAGSAACSFGHIVAMGGIDNSNVVHSSVEVLDPQTQRWSFLTNMATPRMDCAAVVVSDSILVTGGQSEDVLSSTAFLRQEVNEWQEGPPMISPRYGHGILLANL